MLVVIYLLLLVTFRSVLLPLKAIAMNVASVAATYGVLVVVFQRGAGAGLLGFETSGHVTSFVPVLLLTLLFSLSTDYEVFLLSRIREEWLATGDDRVAVARGLALTAPLISGAAVLMLAVFARVRPRQRATRARARPRHGRRDRPRRHLGAPRARAGVDAAHGPVELVAPPPRRDPGHPQGSAATRPADAGPRGGRRPSAGCQPRWARRTLLRWGVGHPRRPAAEAGFG